MMGSRDLSKKVLASLLTMSCVYLGGTYALPVAEAATLVTSADQNITLPSTGDKTQEFSESNKVYNGDKQVVYLLNAEGDPNRKAIFSGNSTVIANNGTNSKQLTALTAYDGAMVELNADLTDLSAVSSKNGVSVIAVVNTSGDNYGSAIKFNSAETKINAEAVGTATGVYNEKYSGAQFSEATVSNITAQSQNNDAYALLNGGNTSINGAVNLKATTDVGDAMGLVGRYESSGFEWQRVGGTITTSADSVVNIDVTSTKGRTVGILAEKSGAVTVNGALAISTNAAANNGFGVWANKDKSKVVIDGKTDIKVDRTAHDSDFKLARALHAVKGGIIEVNTGGKSNVVTVDGDLYADGKGYTDGSGMSLEMVVNPWTHWEQDTDLDLRSLNTGEPSARLATDLPSDGSSYINFVMDKEGSYLYGAANGNVYITAAKGTEWQVTSDSDFMELSVNEGLIDLSHQEHYYKESNPYQKMSIDTLSGNNGNFIINTDILNTTGVTVVKAGTEIYHGGTLNGNDYTYADGLKTVSLTDPESYTRYGDFIHAENSNRSMTHNVQVIDKAFIDEADVTGQYLKFARVTDDITFKAAKTQVSSFYNYTPILLQTKEENNAANSELVNKDAFDNLDWVDSNNRDWWITGYDKNVADDPKVPVASLASSFAGWRWWNENDTLLKRMGELRYSTDDGGDWIRIIRSKHNRNGEYGFTNHMTTVQIGYDKREVKENGVWRKGVALSRGVGTSSYTKGNGENSNNSLALYGTWLGNKGHYLDLVLKGSRLHNEHETYGEFADRGIGKNWAGSVSAEYGRKKKLNEANWHIEPQAQLTYGHLWGDSYTTSRGIEVETDDMNSLVGRMGVVLSREFDENTNKASRYYVKASVLHEFFGDDRVALHDTASGDRLTFNDSQGGTWYEVGIGTNVLLSERTNFYFDIEKTFGGKVRTPYRIEGGFRWEF